MAGNAGNAANQLYRYTGGQIDLTGVSRENSIKANLAQVAGEYASQGVKQNENVIYENSKRMERTMAVMSLVGGDFDKAKSAAAYDRAKQSFERTTSGTDFYSKIGYGHTATNELHSFMSSCNFTVTQINTQARKEKKKLLEEELETLSPADTERKKQILKELSDIEFNLPDSTMVIDGLDFTESELDSLFRFGQVAREDGRILRFAKESDASVFTGKYQAHKAEKSRRESISNASSIDEKSGAMGTLQSRAISFLRTQPGLKDFCDPSRKKKGETDEHFHIRECRERKAELAEQLKVLDPSEVTARNQIHQQMSYLNTFEEELAVGGHKGFTGQQRYGVRILSNKVLGSDMTTGIEAYRRIGQVTAASVRLVSRVSYAIDNKMTQYVIKNGVFSEKSVDKLLNGKGSFQNVCEKIGTGMEKINRFSNNQAKKHGAKIDKKIAEDKERLLAKRNGTYKEYKAELKESRRKEKMTHRANVRMERNNRFRTEKQTLLAKKDAGTITTKESKRLEQLVRREKRLSRRTEFYNSDKMNWARKARENFQAADKKVRDITNKIGGVFMKPLRAINKVVTAVKQFATKMIMKLIIIPLGAIVGVFLIMALLATIFSYVAFFLSADIGTDLAGALNNQNYIQYIVDDTAKTLSKEFVETAKRDAQIHYKIDEDGKVDSEKYDWYMGVNESELGEIYASEDKKLLLNSVNENLVPVVSMMHYRYLDEINFLNWQTAKGYVYFMYIQSHNRGDYQYKESDSHTTLYENTPVFVASDYVTYTDAGPVITRPAESCGNVYIHGYDKVAFANETYNKIRAAKDSLLTETVSFLFGDMIYVSGKSNGLWNEDIDGKPFDAKGECVTAQGMNSGVLTTARRSEEDYIENFCPGYEHIHNMNIPACAKGTCGLVAHTHTDQCWICPGYEHTHRPNPCIYCAEYSAETGIYTTTLKEHEHLDGNCNFAGNGCPGYEHTHGTDCNTEACTHTHDWTEYEYFFNCGQPASNNSTCIHNNSSHLMYDGNAVLTGCDHVCDEHCCSLEEHTHDFTGNHPCCTKTEHTHTSTDCVDCGDGNGEVTMKQHSHQAFHNLKEPGCYAILWVCPGHCGGHITPIVDTVQDMHFETLCAKDVYKTTKYLQSADFNENFLTERAGFLTLKSWKIYWQIKALEWFVPFHTSPVAELQAIGNRLTMAGAELIDWTTNGLNWVIHLGNVETDGKDKLNQEIAEEADTEDVFDFDGWYKDGVLDTSIIDELTDFYGSYVDLYKEGKEAWADFDVYFPVSQNPVLSPETIKEYMGILNENYPNLSEDRKKVVEEALKGVGNYAYKKDDFNGGLEKTGKTDDAGFVCGVLDRTGIGNPKLSSEGFLGNSGSAGIIYNPGDILVSSTVTKYKDGSEKKGRVAIYIGNLKLPGDIIKHEYYVICSESGEGTLLTFPKDNKSLNELFSKKYIKCYVK